MNGPGAEWTGLAGLTAERGAVRVQCQVSPLSRPTVGTSLVSVPQGIGELKTATGCHRDEMNSVGNIVNDNVISLFGDRW